MMKRLISTLTLMIVIQLVFSMESAANDNRIVGRVVDKDNGEEIVGATLQINSLNCGTISDLNGAFRLEAIPDGTHELEIRYLGYMPKKVNLSTHEYMIIRLERESFKLNEVNVMADPKSHSGSYLIKKSALEYIQPSGFSDLLQLLPGYLSSDGGLSSVQQMTMRQAGSDASTALGSSIIIDGAPISNNANLQSQMSDQTVTDRSTMNGGVDLRTISSDHIDEVEIINGIPSAKYGDLTSGAIIVKSKAGASPLQIRTKIDPLNKIIYVGKGFKFNGNGGSVNVGLDWADSKPDVRNSLDRFNRLTGQLIYSNQIRGEKQSFNYNAKLSISSVMDQLKNDPDLLQSIEYYKVDNSKVTASIYGRWWINAPILKSIEFNLTADNSYEKLEREKIVTQKTATPTALPGVTGQHEGIYLPHEYLSQYSVVGKPLQLWGSISADGYVKLGRLEQKLTAGLNARYEKNNGKGALFDPLLPPWPGERNRAFNSIPGVTTVALFAEDKATLPLGLHTFSLQAGARMTIMTGLDREYLIQGKAYLDPRLNLEWKLPQMNLFSKGVNLSFRLGWGEQTKFPTLDLLFPQQAWFDAVALNYYSQTEANRLVIMNSETKDRVNYNLKPARNRKQEFGVSMESSGATLSITLFREELNNGFGYKTTYFSQIYRKYGELKEPVVGKPSTDDFTSVVDTLLSSYSRPLNGERVVKNGVEYRLILPTIKPIRTTIEINGAWYRSSYDTGLPVEYRPNISLNNAPYPYVGFYNWNQGREREQFNTNIWFNTHLPRYRMFFSCMLQSVWFTSSRSLPFSGMPTHYIGKDGVIKPYTEDDAADPIKGLLVRNFSDNYFRRTSTPVSMSMNLKASKEIGKHLKLSFFVNRIWDYNPVYRTNYDSNARKWEIPFFGTEVRITI
ncbi:MAG: TonB-dependent receptor [Bacteroidales bacterium]